MKTFLATIALASTLLFSTVAHAAWTQSDFVTEIKQSRTSYDEGKTVIYLKNQTCSTGGDFYITNASVNKELQLKLLLAALLSGRSVKLGYNPVTGGGCDVYSVILS